MAKWSLRLLGTSVNADSGDPDSGARRGWSFPVLSTIAALALLLAAVPAVAGELAGKLVSETNFLAALAQAEIWTALSVGMSVGILGMVSAGRGDEQEPLHPRHGAARSFRLTKGRWVPWQKLPANPNPLAPDITVRHPEFGIGKVIKRGEGKDAHRVLLRFEREETTRVKVTIKTISLNVAPLDVWTGSGKPSWNPRGSTFLEALEGLRVQGAFILRRLHGLVGEYPLLPLLVVLVAIGTVVLSRRLTTPARPPTKDEVSASARPETPQDPRLAATVRAIQVTEESP